MGWTISLSKYLKCKGERDMRRNISLILVVGLLIMTLSGCAGTNQPPATGTEKDAASNTAEGFKGVTFSLGTISAASSVDGLAAEKFKKYVEEKSNGKIKIDIFHNSQLGNTMAQIEGVMMGSQDMLIAGSDLYEKWAPELRVMTLCYFFRDDAHLEAFIKSDIFKEAEKKLAANKLMFVNKDFNWVTGPYRVLVTTEPIKSLEDLQGKKLRMPEVETLQKSWSQLGAVPITVTWNETYLAIQQGMVIGLESPLSIVRPNRFTEICKHITRVDTFPQRMGLTMNTDKFNALPGDMQNLLVEAAKVAGDFYTEMTAKNAQADLDAMIKEDGVNYYEIDTAPFREKIKPLMLELEKSGYIEKGLYEKVQAVR